MENEHTNQKLLTTYLMIIYLLILTWIILFKMGFSIQELQYYRNINFIPFHKSVIVNNSIDLSEIYDNILIFLPLGLYISVLKCNWSFLKKVASIISVSFIYEVLQFIFAIGASDITDLIGNTFGGIIGIALYFILCKLFKTDFIANKFINIIALVGTIFVVVLLALLVLVNY